MLAPLHDIPEYRDLLRTALGQRQSRNPAYSLRAFARDLAVSPSRLSEILSGRHHLSPTTATNVAGRLGLSPVECDVFANLVASQAARSALARQQALARLERHREAAGGEQLALEHFAMISQWYHFAILELTKTRGFRPSTVWIAGALGITKVEARSAVARLCRLGFLERQGRRLVLRKPKTAVAASTPSPAIKDFHRQMLEKAIDALYFQAMDERSFGSVVMAVDPEKLPAAREKLLAFRREFAAEFGQGKGTVYGLAVQFFRLDRRP